MILLLLGRTAHDHLGRRCPPHRGLVAVAEEQVGDAGLADDPAGFMTPVEPPSGHREETLVPNDLGSNLEADPLEAQSDLGRVDARVPDVTHLEGGHELEWLAPVDTG